MKNLRLLALFLLITLGGGLIIGFANQPGEWYASLEKPVFTPPDWVFGPAWTILYILIAIAGARTWARGPRSAAMVAWLVQLALNFAWTPVFFTLQRPDIALFIIAALFLAIAIFIALTWRRDRLSALFFVPYLAWVAYAGALNFEIWRLN
jgi:tryptophan-rich sensory protein